MTEVESDTLSNASSRLGSPSSAAQTAFSARQTDTRLHTAAQSPSLSCAATSEYSAARQTLPKTTHRRRASCGQHPSLREAPAGQVIDHQGAGKG